MRKTLRKLSSTIPVAVDGHLYVIPRGFAWSYQDMFASWPDSELADTPIESAVLRAYLLSSIPLPKPECERLFYVSLRYRGVGYMRAQWLWTRARWTGHKFYTQRRKK